MKKTLIESYKTWLAETPEFWKKEAKSAHRKETARLGAHAKRLQAVIDQHQALFDDNIRYKDHATAGYHKDEVARFLKMKKTVNPTDKEIEAVSARQKTLSR